MQATQGREIHYLRLAENGNIGRTVENGDAGYGDPAGDDARQRSICADGENGGRLRRIRANH